MERHDPDHRRRRAWTASLAPGRSRSRRRTTRPTMRSASGTTWPQIDVMTEQGTMNDERRALCRPGSFRVPQEDRGRHAKPRARWSRSSRTRHSVGHCQRCATIVEPRISTQWFVKIKPLAEPAIEAVRDGRIRIVPERFEKVYFNWMENIRDWCISRQLWWGHRIPVWYCQDCGARDLSALEDPTAVPRVRQHRYLEQDPDVLDTWFSSGLWPFQHVGLAGGDGRLRVLLSDVGAGDGLRHPLLLGGAHDHDGARVHRRGALPHRVPARPGAQRERAENLKVAARRRQVRPAERDRRIWLRRAALCPGDQQHAGQRYQAVAHAHRGRAQLCQQDLERDALCARQSGHGRRGRAGNVEPGQPVDWWTNGSSAAATA